MDAVELCRFWGWATAGLLLLAIFGALLLGWRQRVTQHAQRVQLFERERSARRLHDSLLQAMHGLILRFQAVAEQLPAHASVRGAMDAALQRADQVLEAARDQVLALRQRDEPGGSLARALDDFGSELAGDDGPVFSLRIAGRVRELLPAVYDDLRQILEESMLNAFRHAQARRIAVTLRYGRYSFHATVVDDGIGIAPHLLQHGRPGHWGLAGMRERAQCIFATLTLRSRPGAGTSVRLRLKAGDAYLPT